MAPTLPALRPPPGVSPPGHALEPLIGHARRLMAIDAIAFLGVDAQRTRIEPLAEWYVSEEVRRAVEPAQRRGYERLWPGPPERVIETDRALLLPCLEDWEAAPLLLERLWTSLGGEAADRWWRLYRSASIVACPVRPAIGRPIGVLVAASLDPARRLGHRDLEVGDLLAEAGAALLERARVADAEARRAHEELMLKDASEAVSASLEPEVVLERIAHHALRVTGAPKALITRFDPVSNELVTSVRRNLTGHHSGGRYAMHGSVLGEVALTRRPYRSRGEDSARGDGRVADTEGPESVMHVPLELGPRLFGVLTVAHPEPDYFAAGDLELLVKLARLSAAAIANSMDFQHERRVAAALTRGFVPQSLPEVPGFEVGLAYEPAASSPVGGDVYGAWLVPSGEVAVLVGDVTGKGVETAALSSMARFFVEARAWETSDPAEVLEQANTMLAGRLPDDVFVTAFLGFLSPGGLRYACAGHLPPVHLQGGGSASELRAPGLPLGVEDSAGLRSERVTLGPGDLVFAFTDGLSEARRGGELLGAERVREILVRRAATTATAQLPRAVHDEVAAWAGGLADDAVALALRRLPT